MRDKFTIEELVKILGKNSETIRRYIRTGIANEEKLNDMRQYAHEKHKPFRNHIPIDNNIVNLRSTEDNVLALCVVDTTAKTYEVTRESLLVFLQRKYKKQHKLQTLEEAERFLENLILEKNIIDSVQENLQSSVTENAESKFPCFIIPASNSLKAIFDTNIAKEKYYKGLKLIQIIDNDISPNEDAFINNRIIILGIRKEQIVEWIPNIKSIDTLILKKQLKFDTKLQAIAFLLEGLYLSWEDRNYEPVERKLLLEIASLNGIPEENFKELEKAAELAYTKTVAQTLINK